MLKGRCGVVTGAGGGIGYATALKWIEEGANVICADINYEGVKTCAEECNELAKESGGNNVRAYAIKADISKKEDNISMVKFCVEKFGKIDMFFANAGILNKNVPLADESEESFMRTMSINSLGTFMGIKYSSEAMKKCGVTKGAIVCTASIAAIRADLTPLQYTASKGSIISMVQSANDRLLLDGIRVNAVLPGGVATDIYFEMARNLDADGFVLEGYDAKRFPPIDPSEIADVVTFLMSERSSCIKGQTIIADGGMSQSMGSQPYPKRKKSKTKAKL